MWLSGCTWRAFLVHTTMLTGLPGIFPKVRVSVRVGIGVGIGDPPDWPAII